MRACRVVSLVGAAVAIAMGLFALAGRVFNFERAISSVSDGITTKANTAACLLMGGVSLLLLRDPPPRRRVASVIARGLAVIVAVAGALTLLEHITGHDFGIDQLLVNELPGEPATARPGRMGPPASACFVLAGAALLMLDVRTRRRGRAPSQYMAVLIGLIVLLPLIGYAYGIHSLYGVSRYTGIALPSAVALGFLGAGILCARPTRGLMAHVTADDAGGMMARRMLIPAVLIPFALGWLRTIGQRHGWFDDSFGRPILILSVIVSFTALVWWNARAMSALGLARARAEDERARSEHALRESEERLRLGLQAGNTGTWDWDIVANRVVWSERLYAFHALRPDQFDGTVEAFGRLVHPDDSQRVSAAIDKAIRDGEPYEIEFRAVRPDGGVRWLSTAGQVKFDDARRPVRMLGATIDVTDRKLAEQSLRQRAAENERLTEQLRQRAAELARANAAKDEFLAILSHELRTPLTPVLLATSLMESHPDLPPDLREDVATIRRNVELESRLISDLLDVTRIARGKLQLDIQPVDLHLIVRSAIDICQREASARMVVDLAASRHTVRGDATRLQQIFWNLVNNAQKFTAPGGTITVRSRDVAPHPDHGHGHRVCVEIVDTGIGIEPSTIPKLFDAFEQGEVRAARQHAGLGLGLAISRKLAEAHAGTISGHSDGPGRGATFRVELPAVESPAHARGPHEHDGPAVPRDGGASLSILLVEDHEPTLEVLTKLLHRLGHRVTGVQSVASAKAAAGYDGFDLLVSDLGLPDGSGLDVMRHLKDKFTGRAIALTGYGMESDIAASLGAGFTEHLIKPVDLATLDAAIRRVARRPDHAASIR